MTVIAFEEWLHDRLQPESAASRFWMATSPLRQRTLVYWQRARTRRQLAALDARMLADIGLDREQMLEETRKPFWIA